MCSRFFSYTSYQSVRQSLLFPFANEEIRACVSYPRTDKLEVEFIPEKSLCSLHLCAGSSTSPSGPASPPPPWSRPLLGSLPVSAPKKMCCFPEGTSSYLGMPPVTGKGLRVSSAVLIRELCWSGRAHRRLCAGCRRLVT